MSSSGCSAENSEPYALRVVGDSMSPEFVDGHIIIVDPSLGACHEVYVVIEFNSEILFGQYRQENGSQWIYYLNTNYTPIELTTAYEVKGVVVQRSTGRRRETKYYDYPGIDTPTLVSY